MNNIEALKAIDGNEYLVQNAQTTQSTAFDEIYYNQTETNSLDSIFNKVSEETGVNVNLLKAVAQAESGFDAEAVSCCGAQGMMQLMPSTAESLGVDDPFDAEQNIRGGAQVLSYLLEDYQGNVSLALAAYNAGSGNVAKYGGVPPFDETRNYISKINNILGGALSNDATTITGATATDLASVSTDAAPDVALRGSESVNQSRQQPVVQTGLEDTDSRETLLSFEEYMQFVDSYQQVMDRLFETVNQSTESSNDTVEDTLIGSLNESEQTFMDVAQMNYNMVSQLTMDSSLKTDAQSLYQAQASVVSPLVERLLNQ